MIIEHVTGHGAEVFITAPDTPVSEEQQKQIETIVARHLKGEPLTRIIGVREFWGLEFAVTLDVLDPRPDTETLIEAALKWSKERTNQASHPSESWDLTSIKQEDPKSSLGCVKIKKKLRILDLGTGTGCIPISLLSELSHATAVAVDKSIRALNVARRNAEIHNVSDRIKFVQGDWFDGIEEQEFDLIVSNPPYISDSVIQNLDDSVKNHDPFMALSGGESGLECYKKIIFGLRTYLNEQNRAFLEIGFDQLESVTRLVDDSNLWLVQSIKDLGGNDRVVEIAKRPSGDK